MLVGWTCKGLDHSRIDDISKEAHIANVETILENRGLMRFGHWLWREQAQPHLWEVTETRCFLGDGAEVDRNRDG